MTPFYQAFQIALDIAAVPAVFLVQGPGQPLGQGIAGRGQEFGSSLQKAGNEAALFQHASSELAGPTACGHRAYFSSALAR